MNDSHEAAFQSSILGVLAQALVTVGVAANEKDRRFEATDIEGASKALKDRLKQAGYVGEALRIAPLIHPRADVDTLLYDSARYGTVSAAEDAWQRDFRERSHLDIENRVNDWLERLETLRSQMSDWTHSEEFSDVSIVDQAPAIMSEDMMRRFDVDPREMPVFELRTQSQRVMRFQPKGLWIVGANGRVDLITKSAAPMLVDQSAPFSRPAKWVIYDSKTQSKPVPLTSDSFQAIVRAGLA